MYTLQEQIGMRLSELRKAHHMTQEQFAEALDISVKHCSHVERGVSCLSLEKLIEVSELYNISLDYIINGKNMLGTNDPIPDIIFSIYQSSDEQEKELLTSYLNMYSKLREKKEKSE